MDLLLWLPEPQATAEGKADCVLYAVQVTLEKPLACHFDSYRLQQGDGSSGGRL
jgi:hypothetical protein